MIISIIDTETTGLSQEKGARIIEIGIVRYDFLSASKLDAWVQRIDPQCPIETGAQEVHGISYEELVGQPFWEDLAVEISSRLESCDLLVAHNMGFDGPFIAAELMRVGVEVPKVQSFCTMENARWACPDGKLPKLGELCFALNIPYDAAKAHSALYDIERTAECFFEGYKRGFYTLPESLSSEKREMTGFKNCHDVPLVGG